MKKTIILLLALALLFSLASCASGTGKVETTSPAETESDKTTLDSESDKSSDVSSTPALSDKTEELDKPESTDKPEASVTPAVQFEKDPSIVTIAVIVPDKSYETGSALDGMRLAVDQAARTGLGDKSFKLSLYYADIELSTAKSEKNEEKIYSQLLETAQGAGAYAAVLLNAPAAATAAAEQCGIPVVTVESMSDKLFSVLSDDASLGADLADFAFDMLSMPKTAVIYGDEQSALAQAFEKQALSRALPLSSISRLGEKAKPEEAVKTALDGEPQVLFIACGEEETASLCKAARAQGFTGRILILGCEENADILALDSIVSVVDYSPADTARANESFISAFESHYGEKPSEQAALSYDAMKLVTNAIVSAAESTELDGSGQAIEALRGTLLNSTYGGVSGKIEFAGTAVPSREHVYLRINGGSCEFYTRY